MADAHGDHDIHGSANHASGDHQSGPDPINWFSTSYTGGCAGENAQFDSPPLGFAIFNFSLLIAGIVWVIKKNRVSASLKQAQDDVREQIEVATRMREAAAEKMADVQRRSDALDTELEAMRENAKKAAEAEKSRILSDAKLEADRLQRQGQRAIEQEFKKAQQSLAEDTLSLACSMAQGMLTSEVSSSDHGRLQDQFIRELLSTKRRPIGKADGGGGTGSLGSNRPTLGNVVAQKTSTSIPAAGLSSAAATLSSSPAKGGRSL